MTIGLPMIAARDRVALRGLRRTVFGMAAFIALYVLLVAYVYPRL